MASKLLHTTDDHPNTRTRRRFTLGETIESSKGATSTLTLTSDKLKLGDLLEFAYYAGESTKPIVSGWHQGEDEDERCQWAFISPRGAVHLCGAEYHVTRQGALPPAEALELIMGNDERRRCRNCGDYLGPKRLGRGRVPICLDPAECAERVRIRHKSNPTWQRYASFARADVAAPHKPKDNVRRAEQQAARRAADPEGNRARDREHHAASRAKRSEPKLCKCECGGMTKGGTFLPGHDSKYHARIKREAATT